MNSEHTSVTRISQVKNAPVSNSTQACFVVLYGPHIGQRYFLNQGESVIGRTQTASLFLDHESVSRKHARVVRDVDSTTLTDLHSTNGTFVNHTRVQSVVLQDGDQVRVGDVVLKYLIGDHIEARYHEEMYKLSTLDGLTGVYNKRFFTELLETEAERAMRYQRALSLLMCDVDHFKKINDTYGHLAGDHVLRTLGALLNQHVRKQDMAARYGGEEFAVVSPETPALGAVQLAEKIRVLVAQQVFEYAGVSMPVTISIGVATWCEQGPPKCDATALLAEADGYLQKAKQEGRNRVCSKPTP
jgi:two-component system cell cycle response regulator